MPRTSEAKVTRPVAQLAKLDLNLLVILRELIRERNVTRAAERVAVTQPAASAALARLRRHFDDELLVRRGTDYLLSPLAAQLAEHVEAACAAAERVFAARLAEKLAEPLDLRIMPMPGASEAIVEALRWCEDYDDDPAHRWLRQNLQMLAAEV